MLLRWNSRIVELTIWLGIVPFIGHELDAVARHEWRLLPGLSSFENDIGRDLFVLLHILMLAFTFWVTTHPVDKFRTRDRAIIAGLLIIHAGLHFALSGHQPHEFQGIVTLITIYGSALAAGAHLLLQAIDPTR